MAIHLETQNEQEVIQVRSREIQLENTQKLNDIIPVINDIESADLQQIESNTSEIKDIVNKNLENQPDIVELYDLMNDLNKNLSNIKGQITKLSNKVTTLSNDIKNEE